MSLIEDFTYELSRIDERNRSEETKFVKTGSHVEQRERLTGEWGGGPWETYDEEVDDGYRETISVTYDKEGYLEAVIELIKKEEYSSLSYLLGFDTFLRKISQARQAWQTRDEKPIQTAKQEYDLSLEHYEKTRERYLEAQRCHDRLERKYLEAESLREQKVDDLYDKSGKLEKAIRDAENRYNDKCRQLISFTKSAKYTLWQELKAKNQPRIDALDRIAERLSERIKKSMKGSAIAKEKAAARETLSLRCALLNNAKDWLAASKQKHNKLVENVDNQYINTIWTLICDLKARVEEQEQGLSSQYSL